MLSGPLGSGGSDRPAAEATLSETPLKKRADHVKRLALYEQLVVAVPDECSSSAWQIDPEVMSSVVGEE
jgi:hypothetical protein